MLKKLKFKIVGMCPLMTHNERLANPRDPITKELKALNAKNRGKNKTEAVDDEVMRLGWQGGLYLDEDGHPALPSDNLIATIKNAAKKSKQGKTVESAVFADDQFFKLQYSGPKDPEAMWADGSFLDFRGVGIQGKRIMRARPIFRHWSATCELSYDDEQLNEDQLKDFITVGGTQIGVCERRPRYGRFSVDFS